MEEKKYLIAYTEKSNTDFKRKPWIHPSTHPMNLEDIQKEFAFIENVVKVSGIIFEVDPDNIPDEITWEYVNQHKL